MISEAPRRSLAIALLLGVLPAGCVGRPPLALITKNGAGSVKLGMTLAEVRRGAPELRLERGSDGDGVILVDAWLESELVYQIFAGEESDQVPIREDARVEHIRVFRSDEVTAEGVHVGMLLSEVQKRLGPLIEIQRSEIESREFATFQRQEPGISFLVGHGDTGLYPGAAYRTRRYRPEAQIEGIWIDRLGPVLLGAGPCVPDDRPAVEVRFERTSSRERLQLSGPLLSGRRGSIRVVASVQPRHEVLGTLALVSTLEVLVAPYPLPPELEGREIAKAVSWGVPVNIENLTAQALVVHPPCDRKEAVVFEIDLDQVLSAHFPRTEDSLWLWALRVRVRTVDRNGRILAEGAAELEIPPPSES